MNTRHLLMSAGLVGAAWLAFFGDKSANTEAAQALVRQSAMPPSIPSAPVGNGIIRSSTLLEAAPQVSHKSQTAQGETEVRILALQPRAALMDTAIGHGGDGLFSSKSWTPPPKLAKLEPPPPPTAPPLPFAYLGKQTSGGQMEVYLARGDEIIVVRDKSVIQNTYRVESDQAANSFFGVFTLE